MRRGAIFRGGIGDDAATPPPAVVPQAVDSQVLRALDERTALILRRIEEQNEARKWALMIGGVSALFAFVKLGIIVIGTRRRP